MQGTNGGEAFQFGAARDAQTAADTSQLSGNVSTGAATFSFIQVLAASLTIHSTPHSFSHSCKKIFPCDSPNIALYAPGEAWHDRAECNSLQHCLHFQLEGQAVDLYTHGPATF